MISALVKLLALCPDHLKWDQNLPFAPLRPPISLPREAYLFWVCCDTIRIEAPKFSEWFAFIFVSLTVLAKTGHKLELNFPSILRIYQSFDTERRIHKFWRQNGKADIICRYLHWNRLCLPSFSWEMNSFSNVSTLPNKKHSTSGPVFTLRKTLCFRPTGKGQDLGKGHDNISLTLSLSQAVSSRR